ncbi:unnamed protein product [Orchesella dallaii]|uniref:Uncharacterized protein n=1 Tax=Orchesella dallaii TaxID=48710 RepID=A0ABP1SA59_9HEXA
MLNSLQSMFGKPHRVKPSHGESCMTLGASQPKSDTPFSQAPQELSITVSTSDDRNEDSGSDITHDSHDHDEQAEELRSNEMLTNPNDVGKEKASLAGLEMLLRMDYYLGLSPFRLSTQGKVVSCCGSKVMYWLMNILAMLQVFISVRYYANLLDKDIRRKDDIFLCIGIGQHVANGLLQFHYFYLLWNYQETMSKIIRKLKHSTWAPDLQQPLVYHPL